MSSNPCPIDPAEWVQPREIPALSQGRISLTHAKRLLRDRDTNGLAEAGAARLIGVKGLLHYPTVLAHVFGQSEAA